MQFMARLEERAARTDPPLEPRRLSAFTCGQFKWRCGSQFYAVPSFILGAIESLVGCLDHLLGLAVTGAGLGHSYAYRH